MIIPYTRWYPAIDIRQSRRQYDRSKPLSTETLSALKGTCAEFRPFPGIRVEVITEKPGKIFDFILGFYGLIHNPAAALAFIGDMRQPQVQDTLGYTGEGVILEATALGLGTCWVAGFFRPAAVIQRLHLAPDEKVLAVSPLGYPPNKKTFGEQLMKGFASSRRRQPLTDLVSGLPEKEWPVWLKPAIEAARIAPSAVNRQPWRFKVQNGSFSITTDPGVLDIHASKRLDCGIAMLHFEVAALNSGMQGRWELQDPPCVASYVYQ
jgi:hypothetical protein